MYCRPDAMKASTPAPHKSPSTIVQPTLHETKKVQPRKIAQKKLNQFFNHKITSVDLHSRIPDKPKSAIRILHLNVNSLADSTPTKLDLLLHNTVKTQTDISLLTKPFLNRNSSHSHTKLRTSLQQNYQYSQYIVSSTPTILHSTYQPGGTLSLISSPISGNIKTKSADTQGRWTWMTLHGKQDTSILLINAYMPCKTTISSAGPSTYYMQLHRLLKINHPDNATHTHKHGQTSLRSFTPSHNSTHTPSLAWMPTSTVTLTSPRLTPSYTLPVSSTSPLYALTKSSIHRPTTLGLTESTLQFSLPP